MTELFDVIVIGTGSAASGVAAQCRAAGRTVAIIDSRPFGGTCALRGCDPKKVLVGAAEVIDACSRMLGKGVTANEVRMDWQELMRFKRSFTEPVPHRREQSFRDSGIVTFHGRARFDTPDQLRVGDALLSGEQFVIATGAAPAPLHIEGEDLLTNSDQFLELDRLPASIAFVGGGYIAFEFAHIAARAGARVTILHRGKRPLDRFEPELVDMLVERTRKLGIEVHLEAAVNRVEKSAGRLRVHSRSVTLDADMVVHAAGRVPDLDDLQLQAAGVETEARGVKVNEFLQSVSNSRVYAAGDAAAAGAPLTPVAGYQGRIVADNLLHGNRQLADYRGLASVVFSLPPLASAGLTESEARDRQLRFEVHHAKTGEWYSSKRIGEDASTYKVLVEEGTGRILGAHILGDRAEELINVFALAIRAGLHADEVKATLFAYPTHGSDIQYMLQ